MSSITPENTQKINTQEMLFRNFFACVDSKSESYVIPERIFEILDKKSNFDMREKNSYLIVIEKFRVVEEKLAKNGECKHPWKENPELKKIKEEKFEFERKIVELIKSILGETKVKEVMSLTPYPLILYKPAQPYTK